MLTDCVLKQRKAVIFKFFYETVTFQLQFQITSANKIQMKRCHAGLFD